MAWASGKMTTRRLLRNCRIVYAEAFPLLTWGRFLLGNLLPVTLGNMVGMVGATYWFVYLRGVRA